jgi:hypothetical protein
MGWTALPYFIATGGSVVDLDMTAANDDIFSTRNNHLILTNRYLLRGVFGMGANITRLNLQIPVYNAVGRFNIWPLNLSSANILSPPRVAWLDDAAPELPQKEEITFKVTDTASENAYAIPFLFTPGHNRNIPANQLIIPTRWTFTPTQVANQWSAAVALTAEQSLRGGVYSVLGAQAVNAGGIAFRLHFPRARMYLGQYLRPAWLCQQAIGDLEELKIQLSPMIFGEWGRFQTFEQPQISVYSAGTASAASELRLWLAYLGQDEGQLLDPWAAQGWS